MTEQPKVSSATPGKHRNLQIQWLRGLAASMVMIYHTAAYQQSMLEDDRLLNWLSSGLGYFGVALFFAISGYLMSIAIKIQSPFVFLAHRIVRIYPLYVIVCLFFYGLAWLTHRPVTFDPAAWLLMPVINVNYPLLRVEWTLIFEIAFYVSLFLIAWGGFVRRIPAIAVAWLILIFTCSRIWPDLGLTLLMPLYRMLTVSACAPMAAGLLLPGLLKRRLPPVLLFVFAAGAWSLGEHYDIVFESCRWFFGASAVFVLWGMLSLREDSFILRGGWIGRAFARYGDWSYALYLCHVAVIQLVYSKLTDLPAGTTCLCAIGVALLSAATFGQFDLTLYRKLKRLLGLIPERIIRPAIMLYVGIYLIAAGKGCWDYYKLDRDQEQSSVLAAQIAAAGPIAGEDDAVKVAQAAGYTRAPELVGNVDKIEWLGKTGKIEVSTWTMDKVHPSTTVFLAVFQDGQLLTSGVPAYVRRDVLHAYGITIFRRIRTGKVLDAPQASCKAGPVVVMAFTGDRHYNLLPGSAAETCP